MSKKKWPKNQEEESTLFLDAIDGAKPLQHDKAEPFRQRRRPEPLPPQPEYKKKPAEDFADLDIETPETLFYAQPGVQQRIIKDLKRGRIHPELEVDLHGLRVRQAQGVMVQFLNHALSHRYRCVRIIHGKGKGDLESQPILKQKTNQWLRQRKEVLAFCSAPPFDGGTGATYVLLSRKHEDPFR